jgi:hypothetical protein
MTERVFEDGGRFGVTNGGRWIELYVLDPKLGDYHSLDVGQVIVTVNEDAGWNSQRATFHLHSEEATMLKEFLISKGY